MSAESTIGRPAMPPRLDPPLPLPVAAADFFCAISPDPRVAEAFVARLAPGRCGQAVRASSHDGVLHAVVIARAEYPRLGPWIAGHADAPRSAVADTVHRDGNFLAFARGTQSDALRLHCDLPGACTLYYAAAELDGVPLLLASGSLRELQRLRGAPAQVDAIALRRYLATGAVAGTARTLLSGICCLPRGSVLEVRGARLALAQVEMPPLPPDADAGARRRVELLRERLCGVLQRFDRDDVAVALSGGIDSSGLLGMLARLRGPRRPVAAYTFASGAASAARDEMRWARLAAEHAGARHHAVALDPARIAELLRQTAAVQDFPFASPVVLAQAELFRRAAADGVGTMLGGHGPDLLFGGADTHLSLLLMRMLRSGRWLAAARFLPGAGRHFSAGARRLLLSAGRELLSGYSRIEADGRNAPWLAAAFSGDAAPAGAVLQSSRHARPLHALIEAQLTHALGTSTLRYERRNAEAAGIDNVQPYLTASMLSLCLACGEHELVSPQGRTKHVLREAFSGVVPEEILRRERRIGFAVPVRDWLLHDRGWLDRCLDELQGFAPYAGPPPDALRDTLARADAEAARTAFRLWRWITLLEWGRSIDLRYP